MHPVAITRKLQWPPCVASLSKLYPSPASLSLVFRHGSQIEIWNTKKTIKKKTENMLHN